MSFLPLESVRTSQPQLPAGIGRSNPLMRGFFGGVYNPELPDLRFGKLSSGGIQIAPGIAGKGWISASSTAEPAYTGNYSPETSGLTVLVIARRDGAQPDSGFGMAVTLAQVSGTQDPFHLFIKDSGERVRINTTTDDSTLNAETATDWPVGVTQVGVYAWQSGTAIDFFRNGVKQSLSSNDYGSGPSGVLKPAQKLRINLAGLRFNGGVFAVLVWGRKLSDAEIRSVSTNPWQTIEDEEDDYLFIPAAGGGSTLNAAASGGATTSGTASLAAQVALAAIGVSSASGAGNLSASIPLSAAGLSVSGGSANAEAIVTISAAGLAQAAGQAGLSANVLLAAAGAAQAAGNAELAAQLDALATGAAQSSGTANLTGGAPGALSAAGAAISSGSAVLSVTVGLVAAGVAQTSGNATLATQVDAQAAGAAEASGTATGQAGSPGSVSAAGVANASGQASWSSLVTLTAAGFVQAMGAGVWSVDVPLSALGQVIASGSANLTQIADIVDQPAHFSSYVSRTVIFGGNISRIVNFRAFYG